MLPDDVDKLVEESLKALNDRDVDRLLAPLDPEFELFSRLLAVDGRSYKGHEGMERFFAEVDEAFAGARWNLDEICGRTDDHLVIVMRQRMRGRVSQAPVDTSSFQTWTFRDGRIWRVVVHESREDALEAAGLPS